MLQEDFDRSLVTLAMPVQSRLRRELRILEVAGSPDVNSVPSSKALQGQATPNISTATLMTEQAPANPSKGKAKTKKATNGTALSPTSANKIKEEAQNLRRELAQRTDERAQVELELLNAVAALEEEKSALISKLRSVTQQHDGAMGQIDTLTQQIADLKRESALEINAHEKTTQVLKIKSRDLDEAVGALELADREVQRLKVRDEEREADASRDRAHIERLEAELGADVREMSEEIERLQAALAEAHTKIEAKDSVIEDLNDELATNARSKEKEIDHLRKHNSDLRHEIQVVNSVLCSTEKFNDELKEQIEALRDQQAVQLKNDAVDKLRQELDAAKQRNAEAESELGDHRATISSLQKEKIEVANSIERLLQDITSGNSRLQTRLNAKDAECMALRAEIAALRGNSSFGIVTNNATTRTATVDMDGECCQSPRIAMEPVATVSPDRDEIEPPSCGLKGDEAAQRLRDYLKEKQGTARRCRIPSF